MKFKILLLQNHKANFRDTWHEHPLVKGILGFTKKEHSVIIKKMIFLFSPNQPYDIIIALVSQVSDVAHGPLVHYQIILF